MIIIIFDQYKFSKVFIIVSLIKTYQFFFLGIISPVSNSYGKPGLAAANHRLEMLQAAISNDHWLRIDSWEATQTSWTRTKLVLDHHHEDIKKRYGNDTELRLLAGKINLKLKFLFSNICKFRR